jgi:microcystin-dependent protein
MDLTLTGQSDYTLTGVPDTFSRISNGLAGTEGKAEHVNGLAEAITELQALLGNALTLKGSTLDLVARLSRSISADGVWPKGTVFPVNPAPIDGQPFYRTDLDQIFVYDGDSGTWKISFDNAAYALLDASRLFTGDITIKKNTPGIRLIGLEGEGKDYLIRETGGRVSTFVNSGTEQVPIWTEDNFFVDTGDFIFSGADTRLGALLCDGSEFNRTTFARLYAKIGTKFGPGNGTTTANLPNFCGRSPMGSGTGIGGGTAGGQGTKPAGGNALTARAIGAWFGEEGHSLSVAELAPHQHQINTVGDETGSGGFTSAIYDASPASPSLTEQTGSGTAHNTIHPSLACNVFIKT